MAAGLEDFKKRVDKLEASSSSCPHCLGMSAQIQVWQTPSKRETNKADKIQNGVEDAVSNVESRAEDHHQVQTEILQTRIEGLESQHRAQKSDCSNCHVLRAKIDEIEQKLHDQENRSKFLEAEAVARESQAEDFLEELRQRLQNRIDELESQKTIPAYPPSYCNNCDFVSSKIYKARKKSKEFEEKMIRAENKLRGHYHEVDEARKEVYKVLGDLGKAEREIERFRSELDRVKAAASGTRGV